MKAPARHGGKTSQEDKKTMKSIRIQILALLAIVAVGAIASSGLGLYALKRTNALTTQSEQMSDVALHTEKVNHLVTGVVMDSRGIYMAKDAKEADSFAKGNEARFKKLKDEVAALAKATPAHHQDKVAEIGKTIDSFIAFRSETIRLAREDSIAAANAQGNNEANRANRKQVNDLLTAFTTATSAEGDKISADAHAFSELVSTWMPIALAAMLIASIAAAVAFAQARLSKPLTALAGVMGAITKGDTSMTVPSQDRADEIGSMGKAVEVLRQTTETVAALQQQERIDAARRQREAEVMAGVVAQVGAVVESAARGDFTARVSDIPDDAQLKALVEGVNAIAENVDTSTAEFSDVLSAIAGGDLTKPVDGTYEGRLGDLKDAINETSAKLAEIVGTIQSTASDIGNAAREINMGADDLSKRTEEQASSLQQTAATTEELAASVKATANSARQAAEIAKQANAAASSGSAVADEAVAAMARIEVASGKMTEIIRVIEDISFQTNLLALNAAVEAARAGDAGRGFAVVATEVRTLSQKSSEAAKSISALIASSNAEVATGSKLVNQAGQELQAILAASEKVAGTVAEISTASNEQASGIDEMANAVAHLDEMTQANAALSEESAASATALTDRIDQMNGLVGTFRTGAQQTPRALQDLAEKAMAQVSRAPRAHKEPKAPAPAARQATGTTGWEEF